MINKPFFWSLIFGGLMIAIIGNTYGEVVPTDAQIAHSLNNGDAGLIFRYQAYKTKKNYDSQKKYETVDQMIQEQMIPSKHRYFEVYILPPDGSDQEKALAITKLSYFIYLGKPGKYVLSRFVYPSFNGMTSQRIFKDFELEGGKLKYLGDVVALGGRDFFGRGVAEDAVILFKTEEFYSETKKNYPKSAPHTIVDDVLVKEPTPKSAPEIEVKEKK